MNQNYEEVLRLGETVQSLESQGMEIASAWYDFEPASDADIHQLHKICHDSLETLKQLSSRLNDGFHTIHDDQRQTLEHAYNIVQELSASRTAVLEMLHSILDHGTSYKEYLRALSLKEQAALEQASQLTDILGNLSS